MIAMILSAWGWLKRSREWLVLLALAAAAAWLWAHYASVRSERDRARAFGDRVCAAVGVNARAPGYKPGDCTGRIVHLANFERETLATNNRALGEAIADATRKGEADHAAFARASADARTAAEIMEKANAQVGPDDRVGRDWFAALNRTAGLR